MIFTTDPNLVSGYRRRAESAAATTRELSDKSRLTRANRDDFTTTARSRRQSYGKPLSDDESLGVLAWLSDVDRARHAKAEAELQQINMDLQAAEQVGAYAISIGNRVLGHVRDLERADEARIRAENMAKPALMQGTSAR